MADPKNDLPAARSSTPSGQPFSIGDQETVSNWSDNRPANAEHQPTATLFRADELLAGRFRVIRFIGRGGMGEVYEAQDEELNERVAVKTSGFQNDPTDRQIKRFQREIQLARRVTHPNVCRTFDVFRHSWGSPDRPQTLIISMELLSGEPLDRRIRQGGPFTPAEALPLVEQLCAGLYTAHRVGVVHRDFKTSNVILVSARTGSSTGTRPSEPLRAVITDFGLAHADEHPGATLTQIGDLVGTPAYMAPEQIQGGAITPATDIYALGIVIYEMLTGVLPFSAGTPLATAMKRLSQPAPSLRIHIPDVDPKWEAVVTRCLERAPEERYADTEDVARALRGEFVATAVSKHGHSRALAEADAAHPSAGIGRIGKWFERRRAVAAIGVLVLALTGLGIFQLRHHLFQRGSGEAGTPPGGGARQSIAILGFQNLSGKQDANLLGNVLADSLWSQLDVSEVRFIPPSRVEEAKQNLGLGAGATDLRKDQVDAIYNYLGADVLVTGSYTLTGAAASPGIQWNIHLLKANGGESLGSITQSGSETDLNELVLHSGRLVRQQLGIGLSPTEEARMDASLSTNPDAVRDFSEAREKLGTFDVLDATKLLEQSVAADPQFARAHATLAEAWDALGFETKAAEEAKKALDAATGLSTEAHSEVTAQYYAATRDWTKAIQQYAQLWAEYRDEPEYGLSLATTQIRAGKAKDALTTIVQVRSQRLLPGIRAQADLAEARAHGDLADYAQELVLATTAAQTAQSLGANLLLARARILQCFADVNLGDSQKAQPLCEEARKINLSAGDELGAARATNDIANAYYYSGDNAAAEPLYEEALSIAQTIGDAYDEAGALNNLANIKSARGDHAGAIQTFEQAIAVAGERNELGDAALAQQNMAIDLYAEGDRVRGGEMFSEALKSSRDLGDRGLEARILNNKCSTSLAAGALLEARKSCEDSLRIRQEINDHADVGRSLANLGVVQLEQGDLDGARSSLQDSLSALESAGAKNDASYARTSLAEVALESQKPDDAMKDAKDAAVELATEKDADGEAEARGMLARAMLASGDVAGAREQSEKATDLAQQSGDRGTKLDAIVVAALVDAKSGKPQSALKALASAQKDARAAGMTQIEYDARLALGVTQMASGRKADGQVTLQQLAQEAKEHGFELTARKAVAAGRT